MENTFRRGKDLVVIFRNVWVELERLGVKLNLLLCGGRVHFLKRNNREGLYGKGSSERGLLNKKERREGPRGKTAPSSSS